MSDKLPKRRARVDRRRGRVKVITRLVETHPKVNLGQVDDMISQIRDFLAGNAPGRLH
jgi:hypothetical protein